MVLINGKALEMCTHENFASWFPVPSYTLLILSSVEPPSPFTGLMWSLGDRITEVTLLALRWISTVASLSTHVNVRKNEILRVQLRALTLRCQFPPPRFFLSIYARCTYIHARSDCEGLRKS